MHLLGLVCALNAVLLALLCFASHQPNIVDGAGSVLTLAFFPRTKLCTKAVCSSRTPSLPSISSPNIIVRVGVASLTRTGSSCRKSAMLQSAVSETNENGVL